MSENDCTNTAIKSVLAIIAHPDDLELMAAGTVKKLVSAGVNISVLCVSDGALILPDGTIFRSSNDANNEAIECSKFLGYEYKNLDYKMLHISYQDEIVFEILQKIKQNDVDTIICPHEGDLHHDHQLVARMAVAASRRVPRILMGQINYFMREYFAPNVFIDISETWDAKIEACKIYKSQWRQDWYEFLDVTSRYYGKIIGVERAEGFYTPKYKIL